MNGDEKYECVRLKVLMSNFVMMDLKCGVDFW